MTENDVSAELTKFTLESQRITRQIVDAARAAIPALLDAGRPHSAKTLQELFFLLDATADAMVKVVGENPTAAFEAILRRLDREARGK